MAYSDFTLRKLKEKLGIDQKKTSLFGSEITLVNPSDRLKADIEEGLNLPLSTEKAKSEAIIYPILKELKRLHPQRFTFFSGYTFDVDKEKELTGVCDFILTKKADIVEVVAPIFCMVEAKNGVIEEAYGQCGAEMVAAKMVNERDNEAGTTVYGAVTNAFEWVFLKLEGKTLLIDSTRYLLNDTAKLLGVFQKIILN
jgi:hypothetical protein